MNDVQYGQRIRKMRLNMGLTQADVAGALDVTPGYICNVENGRTAMSLRVLMYYAKLLNTTLDCLVGELEPDYKASANRNHLSAVLSSLSDSEVDKLIKTIQLWKS